MEAFRCLVVDRMVHQQDNAMLAAPTAETTTATTRIEKEPI